MEDILRSIRGILGEDEGVAFPADDAPANSADNSRAAERSAAQPAARKEPPLAFLRRKPAVPPVEAPAPPVEPAAEAQPTPKDVEPADSLNQRLARHREKLEAERAALRDLAARAAGARATAEAGRPPAEPSDVWADDDALFEAPEPAPPPVADPAEVVTEQARAKPERSADAEPIAFDPRAETRAPEAATSPEGGSTPAIDAEPAAPRLRDVQAFDDIFAGDEMTEAPSHTVRPRRVVLPHVDAEPVDYRGRAASGVGVARGTPDASSHALSGSLEAALDGTFQDLARDMLKERSDDMVGMLESMLRPLLREWLDDNLPSIAERVVREEIERVSRGGR